MRVYFRLSITIPADKLTTVIDVLNREGTDLEIKQIANGSAPSKNTKRHKSDTGHSIDDVMKLFIQTKSGKTFTWDEMSRAAMSAGFAPTSASRPVLAMIADGIVKKIRKGQYQVVRK